MTKGEMDSSEAAALLGRRGGKARLISMTAKERTRIAKLAADTRWKKYKAERRKDTATASAPTNNPYLSSKRGKK